MITKKDFNAIAEILNKNVCKSLDGYKGEHLNFKDGEGLLNELSKYFKSVNPLFDEEKFLTACLK